MVEQGKILELWKRARAAGEEVCLATVVRTEGSSYRKPGARMMLTRSGQRAGTISGGCLEAEIQKKAWWLCEHGPTVECYGSTFDRDKDVPYGLACGGTVWVLLERGDQAARVLNAIANCVEQRVDVAFVCSLSGMSVGTRFILRRDEKSKASYTELIELAEHVLEMRASLLVETEDGPMFAEYMTPPQRLFVFGAGDDAQPMVHWANMLGWHVIVADGRSRLATKARFPLADSVCVLRPEEDSLHALSIEPGDAVIVMTHSYEQDCRVLRHVIPLDFVYLGVLGPSHRTEWLMQHLAVPVGWRSRIHSPAGLNLGAEGPAAIALSILAEIQSVLAGSARDRRFLLAPEGLAS